MIKQKNSGGKRLKTIDYSEGSDFLFLLQILCLAEQIQFTQDVERALKEQNLQQLELELNAKLEHYTMVDTSSEDQANTGNFVCVCVYALLIICVSLRTTTNTNVTDYCAIKKRSHSLIPECTLY